MDKKTDQIKISFIIPIYNLADGNFLSDCLKSIERVRIPNMEVWLIDDGSADGSGDIFDVYAAKDSRFHVIHQENAGVSAARNAGMNRASGEWLFFVDGDDLVPEGLERVFCFEEYENADIVLFSHLRVGEKDKFANKNHSENQTLSVVTSEVVDCLPRLMLEGNIRRSSILSGVNFNSSWGKLYRRSFLKEHRIYFRTLKRSEDMLFNLQIVFLQPRYLRSTEIAYYYRIRSGSVTNRYLPGVSRNNEKTVALVKRLLIERESEKVLHNALNVFIVREFLFCAINDYCHPMNLKSFSKRRAEFRALRANKEFDAALQESNFKELRRFGSTSRISALLSRNKAFFMLSCYLKTVRLLRTYVEKVLQKHIG